MRTTLNRRSQLELYNFLESARKLHFIENDRKIKLQKAQWVCENFRCQQLSSIAKSLNVFQETERQLTRHF